MGCTITSEGDWSFRVPGFLLKMIKLLQGAQSFCLGCSWADTTSCSKSALNDLNLWKINEDVGSYAPGCITAPHQSSEIKLYFATDQETISTSRIIGWRKIGWYEGASYPGFGPHITISELPQATVRANKKILVEGLCDKLWAKYFASRAVEHLGGDAILGRGGNARWESFAKATAPNAERLGFAGMSLDPWASRAESIFVPLPPGKRSLILQMEN